MINLFEKSIIDAHVTDVPSIVVQYQCFTKMINLLEKSIIMLM